MLTLYFAPNTCALAPHILLEEIGANYETVKLDMHAGELRMPEHLARNPLGTVPVLKLEDGQYLNENIAILTYIAQKYGAGTWWPQDALLQSKILQQLSWLASGAHPAFGITYKPKRLAQSPAAQEEVKKAAYQRFASFFDLFNSELEGKKGLLGDEVSLAEPLLATMYRWSLFLKIDHSERPHLQKWAQSFLARPAVQRVLAVHQ